MKVGTYFCILLLYLFTFMIIYCTKILTRRVELRNFFSLFSNMKIPQSNFCNEIYSSFSYFFFVKLHVCKRKKIYTFQQCYKCPLLDDSKSKIHILLQSKAQIPLVSHIKFPFQEQQMSFCAQQFCIYCIVFHSAHYKKKKTQWSGS